MLTPCWGLYACVTSVPDWQPYFDFLLIVAGRTICGWWSEMLQYSPVDATSQLGLLGKPKGLYSNGQIFS
jgi:hypothetical protein